MVCNTGTTCFSLTISQLTIWALLFLWEAQEASPNKDSICNSQRRLTRTLALWKCTLSFRVSCTLRRRTGWWVASCEVVCDGLFTGMFCFLIYHIYCQVWNILFLIWYILSCNIVIRVYAVQNVTLHARPMVRLYRSAWRQCMYVTAVSHFTELYSDIINLCLFLALNKSYTVWQNVKVFVVEVLHGPLVTIVL